MARSYRSFGFILGALASITLAIGVFSVRSNDITAGFDDPGWMLPTEHVVYIVAPDLEFPDVSIVLDKHNPPARPDKVDERYASQNQPGQNWRFAADTYRHIDPGRLLI